MKILSIETSCDETAISLIEVSGETKTPNFKVLGNNLVSQINLHKEYGGVYPNIAKREHAKNLPIILEATLKDSGLLNKEQASINEDEIRNLLEREKSMTDELVTLLKKIRKPDIDYIAVTNGPGLEPALWVGVNFAKALNIAWGVPLIPINHMEGHILSVLIDSKKENETINLANIKFPILSLLISGGHTELVLIKGWMDYEIIGETVDDAVGEAFDKVARILGLPYPGGPEISKLAKDGEENPAIKLPRPMINSGDYNFSFSGLKTAVLYLVRDLIELNEKTKKDIAREFQNAVGDVFIKKIKKAKEEFQASQLIVAGGVAANTYLRERFENELDLEIFLPKRELATDNSIMIGIAGYFNALKGKEKSPDSIQALSNLSLND